MIMMDDPVVRQVTSRSTGARSTRLAAGRAAGRVHLQVDTAVDPAARRRAAGMPATRPAVALLAAALAVFLPGPTHAGDPETLTVEEALRLAESAGGDLERARIAVDQARDDLAIARSRRLPQITGQASASYLANPPDGMAIEAGEFGTMPDPAGGLPIDIPDSRIEVVPDAESTFFSISGSLRQSLFTWGKISEGIEAAQAERDALTAELVGERADIARNTREAYFSTLLAARTAETLRAAEELVEQVVADRREAYDAGARTWEEVLQIRSEESTVRRQRVAAEQGERSARRALALLTGIETETITLESEFRESVDPAPLPAAVDRAIAFSPDLRALQHRARAAERALTIAERTDRLRYPDLALILDLELSGQRVPFSANWTDTWDAGLTLTIATEFTIYDGGAQRARIRRAEGDLRSARLGASDARDGVELAVTRSHESVIAAEAELADAEAKLEYAAEQRRNAEVSYENDLITREELLLARLRESFSHIERDTAAFSLENALTELESLTGEIVNAR